jgi:hypothetical protein
VSASVVNGGRVVFERVRIRSRVAIAAIAAVAWLAGFGLICTNAVAFVQMSGIYVTIVSPTQSAPPVVPTLTPAVINDNLDISQEFITMSPGAFFSAARTGMSTLRLLDLAGVAASNLTGMTITDRTPSPSNPIVSLTPAEATTGFNNPNPEDTQPSFALFGTAGDLTCMYFFRPMRDSLSDDNQRDAFACGVASREDAGIDVELDVKASVFVVGVPTVSSGQVNLNQNVGFGAPPVTLDGVRKTSGLTYTWDFGDGLTGVGANPSHRYGVGGRYKIFVTVHDDAGNAGTSPTPVVVNVGDQPANDGTAPDTGDNHGADLTGGGTGKGTASGERAPAQTQPGSVQPDARVRKDKKKASHVRDASARRERLA